MGWVGYHVPPSGLQSDRSGHGHLNVVWSEGCRGAAHCVGGSLHLQLELDAGSPTWSANPISVVRGIVRSPFSVRRLGEGRHRRDPLKRAVAMSRPASLLVLRRPASGVLLRSLEPVVSVAHEAPAESPPTPHGRALQWTCSHWRNYMCICFIPGCVRIFSSSRRPAISILPNDTRKHQRKRKSANCLG